MHGLLIALLTSSGARAGTDPAVHFQVPEIPVGITAAAANATDVASASITVLEGVQVTDVESRVLDATEVVIDARSTMPAAADAQVVDGFAVSMDIPDGLRDGTYAQQIVVEIEYVSSGASDTLRATRFFSVAGGVLQPLTRREFSERVLPTSLALDAAGDWIEHVVGTDVGAVLDAAAEDGHEGGGMDVMIASGASTPGGVNDTGLGE